MPMFSSVRGSQIGPFFQSPRLQGTPKDEPGEMAMCYLCGESVPVSELVQAGEDYVCDGCEDDWKAYVKRLNEQEAQDRADDHADMVRKDRGLKKED